VAWFKTKYKHAPRNPCWAISEYLRLCVLERLASDKDRKD
jgi:hypothetical protein